MEWTLGQLRTRSRGWSDRRREPAGCSGSQAAWPFRRESYRTDPGKVRGWVWARWASLR